MRGARFVNATLLIGLAFGCSETAPQNLHLGIAQLRTMEASLWLSAASRAQRQLTLTLPLPVVTSPNQPEDCPVLDEAIRFSLDGRAPVSESRGSYQERGSDCTSCVIKSCTRLATIVFGVPLEGGRLALVASSPDGEASVLLDVAAAYQPTIVSPQPCYARGGAVELELPPEFLPSIGLAALPVLAPQTPCPVDFALCFGVSLYAHGGDYAQDSSATSSGETVSAFIPTNARAQVDDLYLTYRANSAPPLTTSACTGFAYCTGLPLNYGLFAPVTVEVCP